MVAGSCGPTSLPTSNPQLHEEDPSTVIPQSNLLNLQKQDTTISRVLFC